MKLYDELVARGLIAQVTNEEAIRILRQPLLLARSENGSILDFGDKIRCSLYLWTKMIFRALPGVIFSFSERDIKAARLL